MKSGAVKILFLHGFGGHPEQLGILKTGLEKRGYLVKSPLLPGHSNIPDSLKAVETADYFSFIESEYQKMKKNGDKIFVIGHSVGAALALWLAAKHPEIKGVIVLSGMLKFNFWQKIGLAVLRPLKHFIHDTMVGHRPPYPIGAIYEAEKILWIANQELTNIESPVLAIYGKYDNVADLNNLNLLKKAIKKLASVIITTNDHLPLLSHINYQLENKILDFIRTILKPS